MDTEIATFINFFTQSTDLDIHYYNAKEMLAYQDSCLTIHELLTNESIYLIEANDLECRCMGNQCRFANHFLYPIRLERENNGLISLSSSVSLSKADSIQILANIEPLINSYVKALKTQQQFYMENQLLKRELTSWLQLSSDYFIRIDKAGIITELSQALCLKFKVRNNEYIGRPVTMLLSDGFWEELKVKQETSRMTMLTTVESIADTNYKAIVQPIINQEKISTYLIKLTPVKDQPKVTNKKRQLYRLSDIKGISASIKSIKELTKRIAHGNTTVLLRGESGTGKEVFAQAIHANSKRKNKPFIGINCAAIPEELLESELFGYESGAFTGADRNGKKGRFELANGGTLFLDEIGDMSFSLQAKMLRILQEQRFERVGGQASIAVDVRVIAATHQNLEQMVKEGTFREDLYYRLNVIPLVIPPLRERREDIPLLIEHFMRSFVIDRHGETKYLSEEAWDLLLSYPWPGNIRELRNVVDHFMELEIGNLITPKSLPVYILSSNQTSSYFNQFNAKNTHLSVEKKDRQEQIYMLLDQYGRDTSAKKKVAKEMNISLPTLYRWMKKWNIK